jgi:hypothetical protein
MRKIVWAAPLSALLLLVVLAGSYAARKVLANYSTVPASVAFDYVEPATTDNGFSVEVVIDGRLATEYSARGRRYIEALESAEYELRIHNPTGSRVAVALSVDGMNTIDARHTNAWDAHKWVIDPYGTIHIRGWQMSSENARRFYFTTERDSYGAKIGQTENLGLISAVFFRERKPFVVTPITPGRTRNDQTKENDRVKESNAPPERSESAGTAMPRDAAKERSARSYPPPDDESAATGIGRTISNGVQWIKIDLDPRPAGEITIRYEYRTALVRLGIIPRDYPPRQDVLNRRERAEGFEPKYCPQP